MEILKGKVGIIMGVANSRSIATGISHYLHSQGAELCYSFLPDERGRMEKRAKDAIGATNPRLILPCDVSSDRSLETFFKEVEDVYPKIDFLVHSVAFAPLEDIRCPTFKASREGFLKAMDISVYSFMAAARLVSRKLMTQNGSLVTLSYFGGEKVVGGYNMMGIAKSALESSVKYMAYDLGPQQIRVNSLSAGPVKTLAASAIGDFSDMLGMNAAIAPMEKNVKGEDIGKTAAYLVSDLSSSTTGENIHVDGGYHIMGSPGRAFEKWGFKPRKSY